MIVGLFPPIGSVTPAITGNALVINGHSVMAGTGASPGNSITNNLSTIKGWTEINNAVPGDTIDILLANMSSIPYFNGTTHRYWMYGFDINDTGYATSTPSSYATKTTALITHVHTVKGWPKNRIWALTHFYVSPSNWVGYGMGATQADYHALCAAGTAARNAYNVQSIDLYSTMEFNGVSGGIYNGDAGLDVYLRHPIDAVTPTYGAYIAGILD